MQKAQSLGCRKSYKFVKQIEAGISFFIDWLMNKGIDARAQENMLYVRILCYSMIVWSLKIFFKKKKNKSDFFQIYSGRLSAPEKW